MMVIDRKPHVIKFSKSYKAELDDVWEQSVKENPLRWSKRDDKLDKKNVKRNELIGKIRENFLRQTKGRKHNYGVSENYYYKSGEHKEQFLEILQALGLPKYEPELQQKGSLYDVVDGYYHTNSFSTPLIAKHEPTQRELWIEELRNNSELGTKEPEL